MRRLTWEKAYTHVHTHEEARMQMDIHVHAGTGTRTCVHTHMLAHTPLGGCRIWAWRSQITDLITFWVLGAFLASGLVEHLKIKSPYGSVVIVIGQVYFCYLQPKNSDEFAPYSRKHSVECRENALMPLKEFSSQRFCASAFYG